MKKKLLLGPPNIEEKNKYRAYRNKVNKLINKCKNDYYKNEIDSSRGDIRKMYKLISEATNEKGSKNKNNIQVKNNDMPFSDVKEMANYCNDFFINVGQKMFDEIDDPDEPFVNNYQSVNSMFLTPVRECDIIKQIGSLKNNCAPGIDGIGSRIIKHSHLHLLKPLIHVINLIFKSGVVPRHFKTTVVTPIHKAGDKTDINNFRPISVINTFAKIFEKCLKERLVTFLENNNILSKNQFGFTNGLSTTDAMYELNKQITDHLNVGNKCLSVFLDLAKAFDTVPHNKLLEVLHSYGVRGAALEVFKSYLHERTQILKIGDITSEPFDC